MHPKICLSQFWNLSETAMASFSYWFGDSLAGRLAHSFWAFGDMRQRKPWRVLWTTTIAGFVEMTPVKFVVEKEFQSVYKE
ncbi:hypothetical protein AVEN_4288-1 [Araneus ventricosus]|uniref:Uncharacterized protein n=1 Tax=Araneus ventricosus TaxID=182803 RepID=A0A4Y2PI17_ARAVE|nr:hypothetical protein AVEN_4288-1 [Araneus ventricosus]